MSGFNRVAGYYDALARLVFGNSIVAAQEQYLSEIKEADRVLILGGGTGWILDSIFTVAKPGEIWYIDSSLKMIEKSKLRVRDTSTVHFIHGTEDEIPELKFDVVITNFFLDVFPEERLSEVIRKISTAMSPKGIWLCSDFVDTRKWYQKKLLVMMYLFFRMVANLKNTKLPDWEGSLQNAGFVKTKEKRFWNGFIKSVVVTVQ